jgi:uncharacterized membrane protein
MSAATANSHNHPKTRLLWLDGLRGIAIVLMIIFHFIYDLFYFGWYSTDISGSADWRPFRYFIITLFLISMSFSVSLLHQKHVLWRQYGRWAIKLFLSAVVISIVSRFMFPHEWIYFGILHYILFASIFLILLRQHLIISGVFSAIILSIYFFKFLPHDWPFNYFKPHFLPAQTADFVPIIPWLGVSLAALSAKKIIHLEMFKKIDRFTPSSLQLLGRHSLLIYLVHQPILFAAMGIVQFAISANNGS